MTSLIDAHVHTGVQKYGLIEEHLPALADAGVEQVVLVQHHGEPDNSYLLELAAGEPSRYRVVVNIDPHGPGWRRDVELAAENPLVRGVRLDARDRSGDHYGIELWRRLSEAGLLVSVAGPFPGFVGAPLREVLDRLPGPFRIENLGNLYFSDGRPDDASYRAFLDLSDHPGVSLVWSSFFKHSATGFPWEDGHGVLRDTLSAFGASRIMWSGDINRPALRPGDYLREASLVRDHLPFLSGTDRSAILHDTASRLFGFEEVL